MSEENSDKIRCQIFDCSNLIFMSDLFVPYLF